ncbi:hypothetical protein [Emticicia sp. W12TSBA100-4]
MKTIISKPTNKKLKGEYSSIDELVQEKMMKAAQTLKKVDFSKLSKMA